MADIWRTSGDIVAPVVAGTRRAGLKASFQKVLRNFDEGIHPEAEHTGFYNDPDMMVVGMPGLTDAENRVHMSLWAMSGAPLIVGADLTKLSDATRATLTNPAVLAVDQDALGLQAIKVSGQGSGLEVWSKRLATPGERAVLLLNRTASAASIAVQWSDLGLAGSSADVKDLWGGKDLGSFQDSYSATVPAGDAVMLVVHGSEGRMTRYRPDASSRAAASRALEKNHELVFSRVSSRFPTAAIEIVYTNPGPSTRFAELRVNGQDSTRIAFPSTGGAAGAIWIEARLDRTGAQNELHFSAICEAGPAITSISLE